MFCIQKLSDLGQSLFSTKKSAIFVEVTSPSYAQRKALKDDKDLRSILHCILSILPPIYWGLGSKTKYLTSNNLAELSALSTNNPK